MDKDAFIQLAQDILDSMIGFIAVDNDGLVTYIGRAYAKSLGRTQEECVGRSVEEIIPNTRMNIVLQRGKEEHARYMRATGVPEGEIGTVCSRVFIYREGTPKKENIVGAMAYALFSQRSPDSDMQRLNQELSALRQQNDLYLSHLSEIYQATYNLDEILGVSDAVQQLKEMIRIVANTSASVCILGETGTGKELVANAIHKLSRRTSAPFIKINCAAIPKDLLESELFGYEAGAFTGASRNGKMGKFELADTGSLLLDEIGEMPLNLQSKLLRAIQYGEIERVGGIRPIPVNIRLICSTNRNLKQMVEEKTFRADLYYRINTMEITVPPLRERPEDIPILAAHFIEKVNQRNDLNVTGINPAVYSLMEGYPWPGNIRELEHYIERACILCVDGELMPAHFAALDAVAAASAGFSDHGTTSLHRKANEIEAKMIRNAMEQCNGNKSAAAKMLKITRATLYNKLAKYGIQ